MLHAFGRHHDRLVPVDITRPTDPTLPDLTPPLWIDLFDPDADEVALVAGRFGVRVPSRSDMDEIEPSARLLADGDVEVVTMTVADMTDSGVAKSPVTFALGSGPLVTIRYAAPTPFGNFVHRPLSTNGETTPEAIMIGLIETIVDRIADALEQIGGDIDAVSQQIFHNDARDPNAKTRDLQAILERIGREGDLLTRLRESLVSMNRLVGFHSARHADRKGGRELRNRLKSIQRDVVSLTDHAGFLSSKIGFLLDATLGLINLEQNQIIKIFTVAAVAFLPPTLIASIYGMNFEVIPELRWSFGYPFAIALMIASAALPFAYFRRRGWL